MKATICVCVVFVMAGGARADLASPMPAPSTVAMMREAAPVATPLAETIFVLGQNVVPQTASAVAAAKELPAPPNSAALVITAFGALGIWQVGRSAHRMHIGYVPEWFHAEAPARIGHTVLAGPQLEFQPTPCLFDAACSGHIHLFRQLLPREAAPSCAQQCARGTLPTRAPPVC